MKLEDYIKTLPSDEELDKQLAALRDKQPVREDKTTLSESSLNRVREAWKEHDTGTITGFRGFHDCGNGPRITKNENKGRNSVLRSMILAKGYGLTKVKGSWLENGTDEVGEASYFVVDLKDTGNLKKDLISFGKKFDQDAITFAEANGDYYAISTNTCPDSWPGFGVIGKEERLGMPKFGKTGINGFSRVNKRAFVFERFNQWITKLSFYPTEIRSINTIHKRYPDKQSILNIGSLYE